MEKRSLLLHYGNDILESVARLYQKTEESLAQDVQILKSWMESQPHLPEVLDDKSLQNFFLLNKCKMDKTKRKIDMYYTLRSQLPDIFENVNPKCSNLKEILKIFYLLPLPQMTPEMCRVFVLKCRNKDMLHKLSPYDVVKMANNLQELRLKEDVMVGDIGIVDMEGINMRTILKVTPLFMVKAVRFYKEVYSIPLKGVYVINTHPLVSIILAMVRGLIKPKIFQRIHICKDASIIKEKLPLEILPENYGGNEKSLEELLDLWKLKFEEYDDLFNRLDKLRVNENLRPSQDQISEASR